MVISILINYDSASSFSRVLRLDGMIYLIVPKLAVGLFSEVCFRYETRVQFFCIKDGLQFLLMLQEPIGIPCHHFESTTHFCFVLGVVP